MAKDVSHGWFTEQQAIVAVTLGCIVLAALVVLPYLQYVLFGMVLAYMVWPFQHRLTEHLRRDAAALVLTIATIVAILVPFVYILLALSRQAVAFIETIEEADLNPDGIEAMLLEWGIEVDIEELFEANQELIADGVELIARELLGIVQRLPNVLVGLTISVFVLFVLLRDGHRLVRWTRSMLPIRAPMQDEFADRLDRLMRASVIGNVAAGFIQAVALGFGFWLLGFDNLLLLTVLTFVLALLPLVGAFVVWVPLVGYLVVIGQPGTAVVLLVIGSLVSVSDFYTRPIIIGHSAALNSAIIVLGVFGGLVAFGPIGLVIGPVLIGVAKIAIEATMAARNEALEAQGTQ